MKKLWNLVKREEGLDSAEYAVLGLLIFLVIIARVTAFGTRVLAAFNRIVACF